MADVLRIEPMTESLLVWRCLHGGTLDATHIDLPGPNPNVDWARARSRNVPLLRKLIATYGTCAMVARDGEAIVATLRFYPKALCTFGNGGLGLCLQQDYPAGPSERLVAGELPVLEKLGDKTLFVHCLMIACPVGHPWRYRRKGLGTRLANELIRWGTEQGWSGIEANAYEEIPTLYAISGVAGKRFWEKLGFRVISRDTEPGIGGEILEAVRKDAMAEGISLADVTNRYRMRRELGGVD
jgi:GNAT superfamily N-acetyltransferase